MKAKLRLWRGGGTLILVAGLALGSAPVVSAAGAEVDLDVVTKVVTAYQDLLDSGAPRRRAGMRGRIPAKTRSSRKLKLQFCGCGML